MTLLCAHLKYLMDEHNTKYRFLVANTNANGVYLCFIDYSKHHKELLEMLRNVDIIGKDVIKM